MINLKYFLATSFCIICISLFCFPTNKNYQFYYNKFWNLIDNNTTLALQNIDTAIAIADSTIPSAMLGEAYFSKGYGHFYLSNYTLAFSNYLKAKNIFQNINDTCYLSRTNFNIASTLNMVGNNAGALDYYLESAKYSNCFEEEEGDAMRYYNLALLFIDLNLPHDAKTQFQKAIACDSTPLNASYIQLSKLGITNFMFEDSAHTKYIYKAKNILKQSVNDTTEWAMIFFYGYADIGNMYQKINQPDSALKYYQKAHFIADSLQVKDYLSTSYLNFSSYFENQKKYKKAIDEAQKALQISRSISFSQNSLNAIKTLGSLFEKIENWKEAVIYKNKEISLSDSIYNEKVRYNYLINELENASNQVVQLNKQTVEVEEALTKRTIALVSALNFLFVVLIFFVVMFIQRRKLNQINNKLEVFNANKDKVIATLSHDIRSPLATIDGIIQLIRLNLLNEEEKNAMISNLEQTVKDLNENLESLLTWSLSQMKQVEPQPIKLVLGKQIKSVIHFSMSSAAQKNITIDEQVDQPNFEFNFDEAHFQIILRNLLSNAIKFSHPNTSIIIKTQVIKNELEIKVIDFGEGIDYADFDKVLGAELFHKSQTKSGIGLGLRLVKEYVELNNGQIYFTSTLHKGTTFYVRFKI